jgi:hypothetical protein
MTDILGNIASVSRQLAATWRVTFKDYLSRDEWNIGFVNHPIEWFLEGKDPEVQWLDGPARRTFRADPFAFRVGQEICVLFEQCDYGKPGTISSITLDRISTETIKRARAKNVLRARNRRAAASCAVCR